MRRYTPLWIAAKHGLSEMVSFLLGAGANANLTDRDAMCVAMRGTLCTAPSCAHLLLVFCRTPLATAEEHQYTSQTVDGAVVDFDFVITTLKVCVWWNKDFACVQASFWYQHRVT